MKPRITATVREHPWGAIYFIWRCKLPNHPHGPTGVGLTPHEAYKRWQDRYFGGTCFAAFCVPGPI